tara:strand:- start:393 stop:1604 length:1212 start_codon:yes stop_codon:yes gene_type:complete
MSGPLKGYKILELTSTVSGPFAGMMLADQGADVVKVEPPGIGDLARFMGTTKDGMGAMFSTLNRNKKCICLDFKNPENMEVFLKLAKETDVLIENYRPGIVAKLGIDYESLKKINPKMIYASISGYGQSGPYQNRKVYDPLIQGTVGMPFAQDADSPKLLRTIIYDKVTGLTAAQAITSALLQREREGIGQYLPISMMESALYYNWPDLMINHTFDEGGLNIGELADLFEVYDAKDGSVIMILIPTDDVFNKFCDTFGADLNKDDRFSNTLARLINKDELTVQINKITKEIPAKDLVSKMDAEEVPASICNKLEDVYKDEQVLEQGSIVEIEHPELGKMRMPKPPVNFEGQEEFPRSLAPILGADTREVLADLGIEDDIISSMEEREEQNRIMLASFTPVSTE